MILLDKATNFSLLFKFILSERLTKSVWVSDVSLFLGFTNIVYIQFYTFVEFTMLLYTPITWYKECMNWRIWFSKFSDVLPAFTWIFEGFGKELTFWD